MEGTGKISCSVNNNRVLFQNDGFPPPPLPPSDVLDSFWIPNSNPSFQASASMVNFDDSRREMILERSNEDYSAGGGGFYQPEKKRRLSPEQVNFLEQSFEVENKLEPLRKVQLAKELGLQPRQVAVWFQNRRARYKTKHIEKEYDSLKTNCDKLKADCDSLSKENEKLRNEVQLLKEKLMMSKEKGEAKPGPLFDPMNNKNNLPKPQEQLIIHSTNSQDVFKQEDAASSAKSDVFDSDSPRYTDGIHSSSDFSPDEDNDSLDHGGLIHSPCIFPKLEEEYEEEEEEEEKYHCLQMPPYSCSLGIPIEDQTTPWFWSY